MRGFDLELSQMSGPHLRGSPGWPTLCGGRASAQPGGHGAKGERASVMAVSRVSGLRVQAG